MTIKTVFSLTPLGESKPTYVERHEYATLDEWLDAYNQRFPDDAVEVNTADVERQRAEAFRLADEIGKELRGRSTGNNA